MDKKLTSQKGQSIFDTAWENDAKELIAISDKLPRMKAISCYLPFGWVETSSKMFMFSEFTDSNNLGLLLNKKNKLRAGFMTLGVSKHSGKIYLELEQSFPATFEPQMITKQTNFNYRWTNKEVTITRKLGTTNKKSIKKQIMLLLKECKRFLFMYCQADIKLK
jgi:hypothetical protein